MCPSGGGFFKRFTTYQTGQESELKLKNERNMYTYVFHFHSAPGNEKEKPPVGARVGVDVSDGVDVDFCTVTDADFCAVEAGTDF